MDQPTDEAVVLLVQKGNRDAFNALMERYEAKLLRYAKKFLFYDPDSAEDVIQDVFIKVYTNIHSFDASRKFSSWLYRIAHNELINAIKKKGREHVSFFDPDTLFPHLPSHETADKEIRHNELTAALDMALTKLDVKYREPLILYYFEDMDYKQIADILRIPVATVGVRLRRAKQAMQKLLNKHAA